MLGSQIKPGQKCKLRSLLTFQTTSLGPGHSAIVLSSTPSPSADTEVSCGIGPNSTRSKFPLRAGKPRFPPKPPNRLRQKTGLNVNTNTKFKVSKFKPKDTVGAPSEKLTKELADALGRPFNSDDDLSFTEATEFGYEEETTSKISERNL